MKKMLLMSISVALMSHSVMAKGPHIPSSWTGLYNNEQKISLFFKQKENQISGYSLLNGKAINFTGQLQANGKMSLREHGTGNAVGLFDFKYVVDSNKMEGSWRSTQGNLKPKFFSVESRQCTNAKGEGHYPKASSQLLKDADLHMPLYELQYMRNEIYARHGYAFTNKEWASTFAEFDWYMPCYTNVEKRLTEIEKENIKRIKLVEPYSKDIEWGR